jgi:hypothetical protein
MGGRSTGLKRRVAAAEDLLVDNVVLAARGARLFSVDEDLVTPEKRYFSRRASETMVKLHCRDGREPGPSD